MPSGKWAPIPANSGVVREYPARNREWPERTGAIVVCAGPEIRKEFQGRRSGQLSVDARGSSRPLLGSQRSGSKRWRLSVSKVTGEARPSRVVAQIGRQPSAESPPMRRSGGGAFVVVREREIRLHGEGRQDVSCWMTEGFANREGSR